MNNTSATLMLQTMLVLLEKQSAHMDTSQLPSNYNGIDEEMEKCYGIYGCFAVSYPWVTDTRPVNLFPIPPDHMKVRYPVFTRRNLEIPVILNPEEKEKIQHANLDPRGPFYVISHGYMESGDKTWIQKMAVALLAQEGHEGASVVVVDWRGGSSPPYTQAVANIRLVGVITAHLLYHIYNTLGLSSLDNFHFIGHSLGSHLAGYCGHHLQKKFGLKLGRITGLDPAEPHFAKTVSLVRLDRSDAHYVDVVHTDATSLIRGGFGISESIGHVDFFPNGGHDQPGCNEDVMETIRAEQNSIFHGIRRYLSCNHVRSYEYFTESIAPPCPFLAVQCASYENFLAGECSKCRAMGTGASGGGGSGGGGVCLPLGLHSAHAYRQLEAARALDSTAAPLTMYSLTGDGKHGRTFCRVHYTITWQVSAARQAGEAGQLSIALLDKLGNRTETIPLDRDSTYHRAGEVVRVVVGSRGTGLPPVSAVLEYKYETNLFNPLTWRLASAPALYLDYVHVTSLEYNHDITVCSKDGRPVVAEHPNHFKTKYCPERYRK